MRQETDNTSSDMQFFELRKPAVWGSVGEVFLGGLLSGSGGAETRIKRAGPFVPPISFPWRSFTVVVTERFRQQLEVAQLGAFRYRPIVKSHIPELSWETWDWRSWSPPVSPQGDAVAYLSSLPHSLVAADRMETLWEMLLPDGPTVESYYLVGNWGERQLIVDPATWKGDHISYGESTKIIVVTERAKSFLEKTAKEWVRFTTARFERAPRAAFYLVDARENLIENPSREDLEKHVLVLNEAAKWTRTGGVRLIDSTDWCLGASISGNVQLVNVAARFKRSRMLYDVSRAKQLELLQKLYDADYDSLMREDWDEWENPLMSGPPGPGRIGVKP